MRHASKSHPRKGSDASSLENALAGHLEVGVNWWLTVYAMPTLMSCGRCGDSRKRELTSPRRSAGLGAYTPGRYAVNPK